MPSNRDRIAFNRALMIERQFDAIVCALPANVLLLSGYWPVAGNALAIATPDSVTLLSPKSEVQLIQENSWADAVCDYEVGSLTHLRSMTEVIQPALIDVLRKLNLRDARIGFEAGPWVQPAPYAAPVTFGTAMQELLRACLPCARLEPADDLLEELRLVHTGREIARIRAACVNAWRAFALAREIIRPGQTEKNVAGMVRADHNARPRLHPVSPDILQQGMVFNIEPAVYIVDRCGMRQCEMVACGEGGASLLTEFQNGLDQLVIRC